MKASAHAGSRSTIAARPVAVKGTVAPPLAPGEPAIDLAHLARMTLGERSLEHEVLDLFDRQAEMLLARMAREAPRVVAALAHTLSGSARGVGAWKVAEAATTVESLAGQSGAVALGGAMERLAAAVAEARAAIGELQQAR
jgi:HPt (histidine-containing phosphotransfer) domain-containing protein